MAIQRNQLLSKKEEVLARIDAIEAEQKSIQGNYYTDGCKFPNICAVSEMSVSELVAALKDLKEWQADYYECIRLEQELGLKVYHKSMENTTYYGNSYDEWLMDFKKRAKYLNNEETLDRLEEALNIIERNMSSEEKFNDEMKVLEEILTETEKD